MLPIVYRFARNLYTSSELGPDFHFGGKDSLGWMTSRNTANILGWPPSRPKKHPRPAPEVYLRFEGRILTVPEVYFRFKGLVILHTTSIRSITPTPFRRFYALSTWATAP